MMIEYTIQLGERLVLKLIEKVGVEGSRMSRSLRFIVADHEFDMLWKEGVGMGDKM
jgi:hypothetical protein